MLQGGVLSLSQEASPLRDLKLEMAEDKEIRPPSNRQTGNPSLYVVSIGIPDLHTNQHLSSLRAKANIECLAW